MLSGYLFSIWSQNNPLMIIRIIIRNTRIRHNLVWKTLTKSWACFSWYHILICIHIPKFRPSLHTLWVVKQLTSWEKRPSHQIYKVSDSLHSKSTVLSLFYVFPQHKSWYFSLITYKCDLNNNYRYIWRYHRWDDPYKYRCPNTPSSLPRHN